MVKASKHLRSSTQVSKQVQTYSRPTIDWQRKRRKHVIWMAVAATSAARFKVRNKDPQRYPINV